LSRNPTTKRGLPQQETADFSLLAGERARGPALAWIRTVALLLLAMVAGLVLALHKIFESDMWWHMAQGREAAFGNLVKTNLFSGAYSSYPQLFTSWLFELGSYGSWKLGGSAGVQFEMAALLALAFILIYLACRRRSTILSVLAIEALGFFIIELRATPRPHVASLALMAASTLLVERAREMRSVTPLVWAAALVAFWSNVHAECVFGAALIGMFAMSELVFPSVLTRRQAWLAVAVAVAGTVANMVNPYGFGLFAYLWEGAHATQYVPIAELRPAYWPVYAPYFAYLAGGAGLLLFLRRKVAAWEWLVFSTFAVLGLWHVRFVALSFCATAPLIAVQLDTLVKPAWRIWLVAGVLCTGIAISPRSVADRFGLIGLGPEYIAPSDVLSDRAISFIRSSGLKGPCYNSNILGGYLSWHLYPQVAVFQDSRFQAYPAEFFAKMRDAYASQEDWDKLLAGVDWAVLALSRRGPLAGSGRFPEAIWATVYQDDAIGILVRRSGRFAALAAR
jgi:hypothetical protein